jgi:hypothetical protein
VVGRCTWLPHFDNEPIPAQEEEQVNTLSYQRVATHVPESPRQHENKDEYSALAMDLIQAELIQTPTDDMFACEACCMELST